MPMTTATYENVEQTASELVFGSKEGPAALGDDERARPSRQKRWMRMPGFSALRRHDPSFAGQS
jgi:hypothetical protein